MHQQERKKTKVNMQLHTSILYNLSFKHHNNGISYIHDTASKKNKAM